MDFEQIDIENKGRKVAEGIKITTQCLSCGISYSENFPWFKEEEFICPECGGTLDDEPILEFAREAFDRLRKIRNNQE